jgi:hypothetical protein
MEPRVFLSFKLYRIFVILRVFFFIMPELAPFHEPYIIRVKLKSDVSYEYSKLGKEERKLNY